jgi:hypothetical protein
VSANGNGSVPIIGANALDPDRVRLVEANYQGLVTKIGAVSVLLSDLPIREIREVNRTLQSRAALTAPINVPAEQIAAYVNGLRVDAKIFDLIEQWHRIVKAAQGG